MTRILSIIAAAAIILSLAACTPTYRGIRRTDANPAPVITTPDNGGDESNNNSGQQNERQSNQNAQGDRNAPARDGNIFDRDRGNDNDIFGRDYFEDGRYYADRDGDVRDMEEEARNTLRDLPRERPRTPSQPRINRIPATRLPLN